jgi:hypothetical protein
MTLMKVKFGWQKMRCKRRFEQRFQLPIYIYSEKKHWCINPYRLSIHRAFSLGLFGSIEIDAAGQANLSPDNRHFPSFTSSMVQASDDEPQSRVASAFNFNGVHPGQ